MSTPNLNAAAVANLVAQFHQGPLRCVLAVTGGGSLALSHLLTVPGASNTVLEAVVPYHSAALVQFLGATPDQFCAPATARAMAMSAYQRGLKLLAAAPAAEQANLIGVGLTCGLASTRPKRGAHRAHLAIQTASETAVHSVELVKEARDRRGEEELVAGWLLNMLAAQAGLPERITLPWLPGEIVDSDQVTAPPEWQALLAGTTHAVWHTQGRHGVLGTSLPPGAANAAPVLFPGSFNPLHAGHLGMASVAAAELQRPVAFEIAVHNVDKPPLDFLALQARLRQFSPEQVVWLTRAARFTEKAELFPGGTFVVGADTIERIGAPRYYQGNVTARDAALQSLAAQRVRFLVFGREQAGEFQTLAKLDLPAALVALCQEVPPDRFRLDISSSAIRQANLAEAAS